MPIVNGTWTVPKNALATASDNPNAPEMIRRAFVDLRETLVIPTLDALHTKATSGKKNPKSDRGKTQSEIYLMVGVAVALKSQLECFPEIFKVDLPRAGAGEGEEGDDTVDTQGVTNDVLTKVGKMMGALE